jgi:hypothetical protein
VDLSGAVNFRRSENNKGLHLQPFFIKKASLVGLADQEILVAIATRSFGK